MRRAGAPGSRPRADALTTIVCVRRARRRSIRAQSAWRVESEGVGHDERSCCPDTASGGADYACRTGQRSGVHCQWEIPRSTHHSAGIERGQGCRSLFLDQIFLSFDTTAYGVNVSLVREFSTVRERTVWSRDKQASAAFVGALRNVFRICSWRSVRIPCAPRVTGSGRHRRIAVPVTGTQRVRKRVRGYRLTPPCAARESWLKSRATGCGDSHSRSRSRNRAASTVPSASSCTNFPSTTASGSSPRRACR